jgi:mRNA-degrading endonuclease RelE of RelBE toxin-antitoxin system
MDTPSRIEFARRAVRDVKRMDRAERRRIQAALAELASGTENLDVKQLAGHSPWLRLRTGGWRIIHRPLTADEAAVGGPGWLVARVVNRRELERAIRARNE